MGNVVDISEGRGYQSSEERILELSGHIHECQIEVSNLSNSLIDSRDPIEQQALRNRINEMRAVSAELKKERNSLLDKRPR
jgi:hypothetical protein